MLRYSYNKQYVSFVCPRGIHMVSFNYMPQLFSHHVCVPYVPDTLDSASYVCHTLHAYSWRIAVTLSHHDAGSLLHTHPGVPLPQHIYRHTFIVSNLAPQISTESWVGRTSLWRKVPPKEGRAREGYPDVDSPPFLLCTEKNRSYLVSSFTELKAYELLSKASMQFVEYP